MDSNQALPDETITPEQATLHQQLLDEFMNEQYFPQPHHFAARAEIHKLRARLAELEPKAKAKKSDKAE